MDLKEFKEKLRIRQSQILFILCEDRRVQEPGILLQLIGELRAITGSLKTLEGDNWGKA